MQNKTIITCAVTGAIHTPTMSDALPYRPEDIAQQAIDAAAAGASILHLHARDPETGAPSSDPAHFAAFLPRIKEATDAVVNITTGGGLRMTIDERIAAAQAYAPEMCSLNMGSINFAFHPLAERHESWKFDWEHGYVADSQGYIFRNTFTDIGKIATTMGALGTKFEHECYDVGHLYNLRFCMTQGLFKPPIFIQFIFGILGGIGPDLDNLVFMKRTADRLFGDDYRWSVLGAGAAQMPLGTAAVQLGGHFRVGLEDSLYISRGQLATSNAQQVAKARALVESLGGAVASPAEARAMLGLKGGDQVGF